MLVFGDRVVRVDPRARLAELSAELKVVAASCSAAERHDGYVSALIGAGELAQGLVDAEFEAMGEDELTPLHRAALRLVAALAGKATTTRNGVSPPGCEAEIATLRAMALPQEISCRTPEGFAIYAVFPDAYFDAAKALQLHGPPLVIGLRSIGLTLAAAVAAAAQGTQLVSLRPSGDPFRRELRVSEGLRRRLRDHLGHIAVVDEGPGLSGSSFGAAGDLLADLGVAENRILYMPSHAGDPGDRARRDQLARWRRARRAPALFDDLLRRRPIAGWFEDLVGPVLGVEDLSGGVWTEALPAAGRPPAWRWQERRKFRLTTADGRYLARFAGLGEIGRRKLARARALAAAGFTPEPVALRRGFLLERWVEGLPLAGAPEDRPGFLAHLGGYLGLRARDLAAPAGAAAPELQHMVSVNARQLGGEALAQALARRWSAIGQASPGRPVAIDGRLHPWEWRRDAAGRLWKTDAIDHCEGHDLIGGQDIAWDLAGALVEFDLSAEEADDLRRRVGERAGRAVPPAAVARAEIAYCAFQAGLWTYAAEDPQEAERAGARVELYAGRLRRLALAG